MALTFLASVVLAPFVVVLFGGAFVWWLLTGKRLPGAIGRWIGPPSRLMMNAYPKQVTQMPPDMRAALKALGERQERIHDQAVRDLGREPTPEELEGYWRRPEGPTHGQHESPTS